MPVLPSGRFFYFWGWAVQFLGNVHTIAALVACPKMPTFQGGRPWNEWHHEAFVLALMPRPLDGMVTGQLLEVME
jgi:hypothetical protein